MKYEKSFFQTLLYDQALSADLLAFFFNVNLHLNDKERCQYFKCTYKDKTTVGYINYNSHMLVVKRYNLNSIWHAIKIQFRKSHAFKSFNFARLLHNYNIPTIKPIAVIQKKFWFLKGESFFISQYAEGFPACKLEQEISHEPNKCQEIARSIWCITKQLREHGIYHGDYHLGNFIIANKQPLLIDFDSMKKINRKKVFLKFHHKDLANFCAYLKSAFTKKYFNGYFQETLIE